MILRNIFEQTPIISQTTKNNKGRPNTSLTSNYLCLQCTSIVSEEDRLNHGNAKSHRFCTLSSHPIPSIHIQFRPVRLTLVKLSIREVEPCIAKYVMTWSGILPSRT